MKVLVTGAAGFIGSHLTERFLEEGHEVVGFDNLSTGLPEFLEKAKSFSSFSFIKGDLLDKGQIHEAMIGVNLVAHLAANADVRFGLDHPERDLEQNTIATFNVLEAMRAAGAKEIIFSSTGSIYGESKVIPTPEDAPFPIQTSLYGASKLACEGLISAYSTGYDFKAFLFRFVSILGERYTHGHVFDFYQKLLNNPAEIEVLGNGKQKKSYLYVGDCINAIMHAYNYAQDKLNIFNLGTEEYCQVNDSLGWIVKNLELSPKINYAGGERGWIGDSPFIFLETKKIQALGWKPKYSIEEGILKTLTYLKDNQHLLEKR